MCSAAFLERGYNSVVLGETPEKMYNWKAEKKVSVLGEKSDWSLKFDIVSCLLFMEYSCIEIYMIKATRLLSCGPDPKAWITVALVEISYMNCIFPKLVKYCKE